MKNTFFLFIYLLFISSINAQDEHTDAAARVGLKGITMNFYTSIGLGYHDFQDNKYSAVTYGGARAALAFGMERSNPNARWQLGFDLHGGLTSGNTHGQSGFIINPTIHFRYLKKLNDQIEIGGRWDIFDVFINKINGLGNNSIYALSSSNLYASGTYNKSFNEGRKLIAGLDLGLLSFNRENTSFAFSTPQNLLDNGSFNYQDPAAESPFGLKYFELEPLWKFVNLRTSISWQTKGRSSFVYEWSVRSVAETNGYRATIGTHIVKYRLNLISKTK